MEQRNRINLRYLLLGGLLAVIFAAIKIPFMFFPYVDYESYYSIPAKLICEGAISQAINVYQLIVANPLSAISGNLIFIKIFGYSVFSARLFSLACACAMIIFLVYYFKEKKYWLALVAFAMVNPLSFYYFATAFTDAPFMFFSTTAILLMIYGLDHDNATFKRLSALMMILGGMFKINVFIFIALTVILIVSTSKNIEKKRSEIIEYFILAFVPIFAFYIIMYYLTGKIIAAPSGQEYYLNWQMNAFLFLPRILSQMNLIGLIIAPFMLPIILARSYQKAIKKEIIGSLIAFSILASWIIIYASIKYSAVFGEMRVDMLIRLFSDFTWVIMSISIFFAGLLLFLSGEKIKENKDIKYMFLWLIVGIVLGSATRPADRYILFVILPMFVLLLEHYFYYCRGKYFALILCGLFGLYFIASSVYSFYFCTKGLATQNIAEYVNANNIKIYYNPGRSDSDSVLCHNWYLIRPDLLVYENSKHVVIEEKHLFRTSGESIHQETVKIFGINVKNFLVVRLKT